MIKKLTKRFDVSVMLLYASILLGMYFCQGIPIFEIQEDPERLLRLNEMIPLYIVSLTPGVIFAYIKHKHREKYSPFDITIAILFLILFLSNLYTNLKLPDGESTFPFPQFEDKDPITFTYSLETKLISIFACSISLINAYIFVCELPKKLTNKNRLTAWYIAFLVATLGLVTYSIITQKDLYWGDLTLSNYTQITVFVIDLRSYAILLVYMIYICLYLNNRWPCFVWYLLALFLYWNVYADGSKVCLFIGAALIGGYSLFRLIYTYKNHKIRNSIIVAIGVLLVAALAVIYFKFKDVEGSFVQALVDRLTAFEENAAPSNASREKIWDQSIELMNNSNWLLGLGFVNYGQILRAYQAGLNGGTGWTTDLAHNSFVQLVGTGGILLFVVYIFIFVCMTKWLIKIFKKNVPHVFLTVLFIITYFAHNYSDSATAFFFNCIPHVDAMLLAMIMYVPTAAIYYNEQNPLKKDDIVDLLENKKIKLPYSKVFVSISIGILTSSIYGLSKIENSEVFNIACSILLILASLGFIGVYIDIKKGNFRSLSFIGHVFLPCVLKGTITVFYSYYIYKVCYFDSVIYPYYIIASSMAVYSLLGIFVPYLNKTYEGFKFIGNKLNIKRLNKDLYIN